MKLSATVVCQDEASNIKRCLEALAFCDEIVVVDSGSTDETQNIAKTAGARVIERAWGGMNDQKDFARSQAAGEWVLNVDADEVVSDQLREEISSTITSNPADAAFAIPFRNYYRGAWVRRCGYYPDPHVRLVRRDRCRWDKNVPAHDSVVVDGTTGSLRGHIDHYSFDSMDDYFAKSARYADAFAKKAHADGRRAGPFTILLHAGFRFFKAYVLKAGFLEGTLGVTISGLQSIQAFQKYVRLWELSRFEEN